MNERESMKDNEMIAALIDLYNNAPFYFKVKFNNDKAAENGYTVDELYEKVDTIAAHWGMERTGENIWYANTGNHHEKFTAFNSALLIFPKFSWFMNNVDELLAFDYETPWGDDQLSIYRKHPTPIIA